MLIAPYQGLAETAKSLNIPDDVELDINVANLEEGVKAAQQAEKSGYELIISRGGTASMIQDSVSVPVVHIDISGYDMLRVFTLIRGIKKGVALVGFENISQGAATLCNILEFDVNVITIKSSTEVRGHLERLKEQEYTVVIGDVITVQVAEQIGLRGVLITSGKEALMDALEEGKRVYHLFHKVQNQFSYLKKAFKAAPFPMILLNKNKKVIDKNEQYEQEIPHPEISNSPVISQIVNRVLEYNAIQWDETVSQGKLFRIQAFPLSGSESAVGVILYSSGIESNNKAIQISNPGHIPIIGESKQTRSLRESLEQYANADGGLCILGERGTGKQAIAQAIHFEKFGKTAPLVILDGNVSIQEMKEFIAVLNTIREGSLLLRNISIMSLEKQSKLLEILGHASEKLQVFTLANEPLDSLLIQEKFNEELYKRIAKNTLHLSPLKQRKDDIPSLVNYFLAEFHAESGSETLAIKPEAMECLLQGDWPGNHGQLKQAVREISMITKGYYVEAEHVKELMSNMKDMPSKTIKHGIPVNGTLKEMEQKIINQVLEEEKNNQSRAAKRLGINRSTLWRKLNP